MVKFCLMIDEEAGEFLDNLSGKSNKIVKRKLLILEDNPFPKKGGDKELLISPKYKELYRLHISRSYTAFLSNHSRRKNCDNPMVRHYRPGT